jgi:hypothetical protein
MFINKSLLVPENSRRLAFVKGMTLFFLGASATLLVANGLQIEPNLTQATTSILQKILLVGGDNVATGVYLDGPNSKISAKTICTVDGVHCVDTSQISS